MKTPGLFPILDHPIRVPEAFIVVSWRAGILWVIRDGESSPSMMINIVDIDTDLITGKRRFPPVIIDIQPMKNGHLLIARRNLKSLYASVKYAEQLPKKVRVGEKQIDPPQIEIEWDEVDPINGIIVKPDMSLVEFATNPRTETDAMRFNFGFTMDGKILSPWSSPVVNEKRNKLYNDLFLNSRP